MDETACPGESAARDGTWDRHANSTAMKAADHWLALKPLPSERTAPTPMFGQSAEDGSMTFVLGNEAHAHVSLYIGGHRIHTLAVLHTLTKDQEKSLGGLPCDEKI